MTTLTVTRLGLAPGREPRRELERTIGFAIDELAGRVVWCAATLPADRRAATRLRARLERAGVADARALEIPAAGPSELDLLAAAALLTVDPGVGGRVCEGDVVIGHDPLTALLARALRDGGAHAVWRARPHASASPATAVGLGQPGRTIDALVTERRGRLVGRIPAPDVLAAKEMPASGRLDGAAWGALLADVVHDDRAEHVGGTRHARPAVAAR